MFQSTHPRRVWPSYKIVVVRPFLFQSTHPRRVWLRHITDTVSHHEFQSTHPRRVWLSTAKVSILLSEFQSTHPRRVWPSAFPLNSRYSGFNPHTHAGCDLTENGFYICVNVSIHTPTQGVTNPRPTLYPIIPSFNPHTHAGCDLAISQTLAIWKFQSTHPRRVWLGWMTEHLCY